MKRYYEEGLIDRKWVDEYCMDHWDLCKRYWKEEKGEYHPDWMMPDGTIDEALKGR